MSFIQHISGDLKEGKTREFQAWLAANEKEIANSHPPGARYIGTYFAIYADRDAGQVHTLIEVDSYATLDTLAEAGMDAEGTYGKLVNEFVSFLDQSSNNGVNALYKSATSATLYGD